MEQSAREIEDKHLWRCMFAGVSCNPYQQLFRARQSRRARESSSSSSSSSSFSSSSAAGRQAGGRSYALFSGDLLKQFQDRGLALYCTKCELPVHVAHGSPLKCPTCGATHLDVQPHSSREIVSAR